MKLFATARLAFGLLPAVRQGILVAEEILPGKGKGEQKLILVREFIEDVLVIGEKHGLLGLIWPIIEKWVERIVKRYNENGWPEEIEMPEPKKRGR